MIRGSCLCGGVRFELERAPLMHHCHCSRCRKAHAAAFRTAVTVALPDFRFVSGEDLIQVYRPDPEGYCAPFCRVCGSSVPHRSESRGVAFVPAGLLDDDPGTRPSLHIYVGSKAPWWEIGDAARQCETVPDEPLPDLG